MELALGMLKATQGKIKGRFDKMHRLLPTNQHNSMRKFARWWFEPYTNDNPIYHLTILDGTKLAVSIEDKRVKIFKERYKDVPNS